jgi:2-polyprenyl-3-methyl-5-hydroxy-6-metoxy-1,4-benzoquinol methylase
MQVSESRLVSWNDIAEVYCNQRPTSPTAQVESPIILRMLGSLDRKQILDAGCGGGFYSFSLAEKGARVVGLDIAPSMISYAKAEQIRRGVSPSDLDFRLGDVTDLRGLGFEPETFDMILASYLLDNVENFVETLRELQYVLKEAGTLVVIVPHPVKSAACVDEDRIVIENWFAQREIYANWILGERHIKMKMFHRPTEDYSNSLIAAGFRLAEISAPKTPENVKPRNELDRTLFERRKRLPSSLIYKAIKES